jgi:hypothetical protein
MFREIGDWPLIPNMNSSLSSIVTDTEFSSATSFFGFENMLSKLTLLKMPFLLRFESNDFNNSKILMQIVVPLNFCKLQNFFPNSSLALHRFVKLVKQIRNFMFESLNDIEWNNFYTNDEFDMQLNEMVEVAKRIYFLNDERYHCAKARTGRQKTLNVFTLRELNSKLNENFRAFDFLEYINFINKYAGQVKLNDTTQVVISSLTLSYLSDLFKGIKELNFTQEKMKRAFKNLIYFHLIYSLVKPLEIFSTPHIHMSLPIRYYHAFLEYSKPLNEISPYESFRSMYRINREQNCAYSVIDAFSVVGSTEQVELQRLFLSEKFNSNIKNSTLKILDNLLQVTIEIIKDQEWISSITKNSILKSLNNMEHRIVYSDSIFDESEENKSKHVKINSDMTSRYQLTRHYVKNIFILKKRSYLKELDLIGTRQSERIRSKKYVFDIFLANLMYLKEHNTMLMPAGVLIEPIYSVSSPVYLNYATIGMFFTLFSASFPKTFITVVPNLFEYAEPFVKKIFFAEPLYIRFGKKCVFYSYLNH